ncbi:MAG: DUF3299 domain-containing protein [Myxococcota bacterium]
MSHDTPHREDRPGGRTRSRRWLKYGVIATYLAGLALVPQWVSLGFRSAPTPAEAELEGEERESFQPVSWDTLGGFTYDLQVPGALEDASPEALSERHGQLFPPEVRALDRRPVAVRGFVLPISMRDGRITEFILAAKNEIGCCFGDGLSMNQWIHVAAPEGRSFDLEPLGVATVLGLLEVGEEVRRGTVMSLYRMREAKVRPG